MEIGKTPSGANGILHHAPKAFKRVEVVPTMGGEEMEAKLAVIVLQGRVEFVRPMHPAAIDDHHDLLAGCAESCHHLLERLAQFLGITMGDDFIEDFGGAILHSAEDREQYPAGDAAPGAVAQPGLAFQGLLTFDLTLTQRPYREARTLRCPPPTRAGQGKAPEDGFVFIEQNDLTTTRLVLQGGKCERAVGEVRWGRIQSAGGAVVAYILFFTAQRMLSRPSWTPVCWANTVANARQLHWE